MMKRFAIGLLMACVCSAVTLEPVGEPCHAFNVLSGRIVQSPDGGELLALMNMNENSGAELLLIDFAKNTATVHRAPAGAGAWALQAVPGYRLVAGTFYDGSFMVFDLNTMQWTHSARLGQETYLWSFAIGSDGRVYGGSYPNAHLGAFDPATLQVEEFDRPEGAAPNQYLRNLSSTPDGKILCQYATEKVTTFLFDPKTKKFSAPPASLAGVQMLVTWNHFCVTGGNWDGGLSGVPRALAGPEFKVVEPSPFPAPEGKGEWHVDTYATTPETLYLRQGNAVYSYHAGDKTLTTVTDSAKGIRLFGPASDGSTLGMRGQDYVVIKKGEEKPEIRNTPVQTAPRSTHFMRVDPEGRLWGGPTFGMTVFYMDPATGKTVNTSQVSDAGGEVYDAAFIDGVSYLVAYSAGEVIAFDPAKPWSQAAGTNPHTIVRLHERGYIRPMAGVSVGPDRKLYAGWSAVYGTYGGAASITDPKTGATELIENPLGKQSVAGVATDGPHIFVSTSLAANGLPNQPGAPGFGVVDSGSHKVTFQKSFAEAGSVDHLVYDGHTKKVAFAASGAWHLFDPATETVTPLTDAPKVTSHMLPAVHGGMLYYGAEEKLVSLDLATGKTSVVATSPGRIETVAANPTTGELFCSVGTTVYRVKP